MAGRPIEIIVTSDTSGVEDGSKRIADSLENVQGALTDVQSTAEDTGDALGKSLGEGSEKAASDAQSALKDVEGKLSDVADKADDAGEKLEDSLGDAAKNGAKDAEQGLERVEDALSEVSDAGKDLDRDLTKALNDVGDSSRKAGNDIGDNIKRGTGKAEEGLDEFRDEANSTAREAGASFDGSAEGIADAFQEVAANAFAGFGPQGALAGLAIAAGIGIAITKMQELAEANDEAAQGISDLAARFSEAGGRIQDVDFAEIIKEWGREVNGDNWLTFWVDEAESNFEKYGKLAEEAGVSVKDAIRGMKGTAEDSQGFLDGTIDELERLEQVIKDNTSSGSDGATTITEFGEAAQNQKNKIQELRDAAQDNIDTQNAAIDVYKTETDVLGQNNEALAAAIDLKNELADANLSAAEADIALVAGTQELTEALATNGQTTDINTEAGRNNRTAILDQIGTINDWAQAQIDAGADVGSTTSAMNIQKEALINQVAPYFGSRDAARSYIEQVLKTPKAITTDLKADSSQGQRVVNDFVNQRVTKIIDVRADTSQADRDIAMLNGRRVTVHADAIARVGVPQAN